MGRGCTILLKTSYGMKDNTISKILAKKTYNTFKNQLWDESILATPGPHMVSAYNTFKNQLWDERAICKYLH